MWFKKIILPVVTVLYDIISAFWCYIVSTSIIKNLLYYSAEGAHIGIIGGADAPTLMFMIVNVLGWIAVWTFVPLCVASAISLTVSAFQEHKTLKSNVLSCVLMASSLTAFLLTPAQTYTISLYIFAEKIPLVMYAKYFYIIISLVAIVVNIILVIKQKSEKENLAEKT